MNVYYREAGSGTLQVSVEGPSKADIKLVPRADGFGSCAASYTVEEPGEYNVSVKWNELDVPDSPFVLYIGSENDQARKLTVSSLQDKGLQAGKPVSFTVKYNGAKGKLHGKIETPSGEEDEAQIGEVDVEGYCYFYYYFVRKIL